MSRATLNDLVEDFLRLQLGYGEEFVVNNEIGLLYDVDETENLDKKLSELGKLAQASPLALSKTIIQVSGVTLS
jgi:hypothetical protein